MDTVADEWRSLAQKVESGRRSAILPRSSTPRNTPETSFTSSLHGQADILHLLYCTRIHMSNNSRSHTRLNGMSSRLGACSLQLQLIAEKFIRLRELGELQHCRKPNTTLEITIVLFR